MLRKIIIPLTPRRVTFYMMSSVVGTLLVTFVDFELVVSDEL